MGAANKFLDYAADFMFFVAGCFFAIAGFSNTAAVQNALNSSLVDKGSAVVADAYPNMHVSGEEVIALLLLPDGITEVEVAGYVFSSEIDKGINYIDTDVLYQVTREYLADGVRLIITAYEG